MRPGFFETPAGEVSLRIRRLAMDLAAVMMADPGANSTHEQLLSDLMISVIERFTPWRTMSHRLSHANNNRSRFDWRIRRAVNLIRVEPHLTRDVNSLARESGMSRAHFYRLFERATRMTPHVFISICCAWRWR